MKRNWDTIRKILLAAEEKEAEGSLTLRSFPEEDAFEISYHVELLEEAGLLHANLSKTLGGGPTDFHLMRLTWPGHELLDAIKNDTIWENTKQTISSKGGSMTFELVKTVAIELAKNAVGL